MPLPIGQNGRSLALVRGLEAQQPTTVDASAWYSSEVAYFKTLGNCPRQFEYRVVARCPLGNKCPVRHS